MNRRVWCGSLATTAAWVGFVTAQAPPSAAPAGSSASDGPVYVMKTAGQPERRVKVIKSEKLPDGTFLTDVKDLASGVVYTLTNPAVLGTPTTNTVATATASPPQPANTTGTLPPANTYTPPGTPRPIFGSYSNQPQQVAATPAPAGTNRPLFGSFANQQTAGLRAVEAPPAVSAQGLPQARNRKADPLLAGASTAPAAMTARTPFTPGPNDPPSVLGKFLGEQPKDGPPPRVGSYTPAPVVAPASGVAAPVAVSPPAPQAVAAAPAPPTPTDGLSIPNISPDAKPSAATGIFDSQPPATAAVTIPPLEGSTGLARVLPPIGQATAIEPAPALPAGVDPPLPKLAALPTAVPVPAIEPAPTVAPPPTGFATAALPADVLTMLDGLKNHRRPSFRMENATALAESQYAQHPDVLAALVEGAKADVTGVVRGHCINQLTTLGYSDATYLQSLGTWLTDSEPAVRRAAANARTKLTTGR